MDTEAGQAAAAAVFQRVFQQDLLGPVTPETLHQKLYAALLPRKSSDDDGVPAATAADEAATVAGGSGADERHENHDASKRGFDDGDVAVPVGQPLLNMPLVRPSTPQEQEASGRLGPATVRLNKHALFGRLRFGQHNREIESHQIFSTVRADVAVFRGAWQYEVVLATEGLQQLGWATLACPMNHEEGVGDGSSSYAYDGRRVLKWNVMESPYGQRWTCGDIIGCCIDLDRGTVSFFRNGVPLGDAFTNIHRDTPGMAYFPATSMSPNERVLFNFGNRPFRFPVPGYCPLHAPPPGALPRATRMLLAWFERVVAEEAQPGPAACAASLAHGLIAYHLSSMCSSEYLLDDVVLPWLMQRYDTRVPAEFFQTLASHVPRHDLQTIVRAMVHQLGLFARTAPLARCARDLLPSEQHVTSVSAPWLEVERKHRAGTTHRRDVEVPAMRLRALRVAAELLRQPTLASAAATDPHYASLLESFFATKGLNRIDVTFDLFPVLPIPSSPDPAEEARVTQQFRRDVVEAQDALRLVADARLDLLAALEAGGSRTLSAFVDQVLRRNAPILRAAAQPGLSEYGVAATLCFLLGRLQGREQRHAALQQLPQIAAALPWADVPRLGGTLLHVTSTWPRTETVTPPEDGSPLQLLEAQVFLFHIAVRKQYHSAMVVFQSRQFHLSRMAEAAGAGPAALRTLRDDLFDHTRGAAAYEVKLYAPWQQSVLLRLIDDITSIVVAAANDGAGSSDGVGSQLAYLPQHWLDVLVGAMNALRHMQPPMDWATGEASQRYPGLLRTVVEVVARIWSSDKIINPDVKDVLLQFLARSMRYPDVIDVMETSQVVLSQFFPPLISAYSDRYWNLITAILLRPWIGTGFRDRAVHSPTQPLGRASAVLQHVFVHECETLGLAALGKQFVTPLLNHLNWAVSEFKVATQELVDAQGTRRDVSGVARKLGIVYDLAVNQLRLLEVLVREVPALWLGDSDVLLMQLTQTVLLLMSRTVPGTPSGKAFDQLLDAPQRPSHISRGELLSPLVGLLIAMHTAAAAQNVRPQLAALLTQQALYDAALLGAPVTFAWAPSLGEADAQRMHRYTQLLEDIAAHEAEAAAASPTSAGTDEDSLCTICYSYQIDTQFVPCGHQTCHRCTERLLMDNSKCFFCKAPVTSTEKFAPSS